MKRDAQWLVPAGRHCAALDADHGLSTAFHCSGRRQPPAAPAGGAAGAMPPPVPRCAADAGFPARRRRAAIMHRSTMPGAVKHGHKMIQIKWCAFGIAGMGGRRP
jgi:hypothetical protein